MEYTTHRDGNVNITKGAKHIVKEWTVGVEVEHHARAQLLNATNLPFIEKHIAVMPDTHAGVGCTVGSVIATKKAIVPAFCGVDLGCGVEAVRTTLKASMLPDDLKKMRSAIESAVPHGFATKGRDHGSWGDPPAETNIAWMELEPGYKQIIEKHPKAKHKNPVSQLGTLGGGNHLIEICIDENDEVWFLLHSGSRGPGNKIGTHFIDLAKKDMRRYFINLPDENLAYFPEGTDYFQEYWRALAWAQRYAQVNRELMIQYIAKAVKKTKLVPKFELTDEYISCHHNYVARENHFGQNVLVTRKGAISAREGQGGVILGSMGTPSYVVKGLGCKESFCSASHGAGRRMSRTQAKNTITLKQHREATEGVECKKDASVLDESPAAYKSVEDVMKAQEELVEPVHRLKQVICIKG